MASYLEQIGLLDPLHDHQKIVFLSTCFEFPFDTTRALEFALFRTFCVPRISALLDRTQEFGKRAQKRYDDTDIIVSELMEWGYDSERGKEALRRMNQLHGRFAIVNDDFRYVLSTFVFEPIRWNARFGWRAMCEQEKLAMFYFWCEVGRRMNIRELPETYAEFETFNIAYERDHYRYSESNKAVGRATLEMFAAWFPAFTHPLVRRSMYALMDEPVLAGFGFPKPRWFWRVSVPGALKLRAWFLKFMPARTKPRLRTAMKHRTYPEGYRLNEIGPNA